MWFWGDEDTTDNWPSEKNGQLIDHLKSVVGSFEKEHPARDAALTLLSEAVYLNDARNDFAHSFILAHHRDGRLFVQKVRVTNNARDWRFRRALDGRLSR
jgi:hypothetical protein